MVLIGVMLEEVSKDNYMIKSNDCVTLLACIPWPIMTIGLYDHWSNQNRHHGSILEELLFHGHSPTHETNILKRVSILLIFHLSFVLHFTTNISLNKGKWVVHYYGVLQVHLWKIYFLYRSLLFLLKNLHSLDLYEYHFEKYFSYKRIIQKKNYKLM